MNLLSNAITFSNPQGKITIQSKIENGKLSLCIQDFGKGIEEHNFKYLFERFRQVESGTTKSHMGHGLGLSIVKDFIDALHGDLDIKSKKGETTIVRVTIPELSDDYLSEGLSSGNDILFTDAELF
jgi:signal transduction histidine kinase